VVVDFTVDSEKDLSIIRSEWLSTSIYTNDSKSLVASACIQIQCRQEHHNINLRKIDQAQGSCIVERVSHADDRR
jgi:hypothetical protein